ncbi:MAG TPA: transcription termination factor NusA [Dehalococcoidia bacterium]|nr:transcription termination factor NusA [Dehalococcoidia bacterium]
MTMTADNFIAAIAQLSAEKNLDPDTVLEAVEAAMASALKKDELQYAELEVKIGKESGDITTWRVYQVMDDDEIEDDEIEVSPERAATMGFADAAIGDVVREQLETTPSTGRIAAQTAKQVVLQRLREAERESVFGEFTGKEGELVSGTVLRVEGAHRQVIVDLGRTEAVLPATEQVRPEHYRVGQRLRVFVKEVYRASKGPQVVVSRSHPELLRRLFELEVPEVSRGVVEIMGIVRDPGYRAKVAVLSRQDGIDPIGACVGVRGARIQNIVNELGGERVDLIRWDPNEVAYVANALSPAEVTSIRLDESANTAYMAVPDKQISLAIGKEGQNARLAAKLTGRRIDIQGEGAIIEAGGNFYPPPEPNMDAIPLPGREGLPTLADGAPGAPSAADYTRPGLPGEQAQLVDAEPTLTPEQEAVAEFTEEPAAAAEEAPAAEVVAEPEVVERPTARPAAPGGIRFGEEIGGSRDIEDETASQPQPRRGGRGGRGGGQQPQQPQRTPDSRRSRRRFELDEDDYQNYEDYEDDDEIGEDDIVDDVGDDGDEDE